MANNDQKPEAGSTQTFVEHLESSGFFEQINKFEENLKTLSSDLKSFGETASKRLEETENLAAHVLAIESVLAVMLREHPINAEALTAEVVERTAAISENPEGSQIVHTISQDLLAKSKT